MHPLIKVISIFCRGPVFFIEIRLGATCVCTLIIEDWSESDLRSDAIEIFSPSSDLDLLCLWPVGLCLSYCLSLG